MDENADYTPTTGETEVTDDRPRFVEGDERDELSGLVQMDEPVRIVEIGIAVGVAERPIHALRDADRVRRSKAAGGIRLRVRQRLVVGKRCQLSLRKVLRDVSLPEMRREMQLHPGAPAIEPARLVDGVSNPLPGRAADGGAERVPRRIRGIKRRAALVDL